MNLTDIETRVQARLGGAGIAGLQLVFQNVTPTPDPPIPPYAVITVATDSVSGPALDGSVSILSGRLIVVIVVKEGEGRLIASQLRDSVAGLFPMGLRITGGTPIEFRRPPQPKTGYAQGGNWRLPLEIPFGA